MFERLQAHWRLGFITVVALLLSAFCGGMLGDLVFRCSPVDGQAVCTFEPEIPIVRWIDGTYTFHENQVESVSVVSTDVGVHWVAMKVNGQTIHMRRSSALAAHHLRDSLLQYLHHPRGTFEIRWSAGGGFSKFVVAVVAGLGLCGAIEWWFRMFAHNTVPPSTRKPKPLPWKHREF